MLPSSNLGRKSFPNPVNFHAATATPAHVSSISNPAWFMLRRISGVAIRLSVRRNSPSPCSRIAFDCGNKNELKTGVIVNETIREARIETM